MSCSPCAEKSSAIVVIYCWRRKKIFIAVRPLSPLMSFQAKPMCFFGRIQSGKSIFIRLDQVYILFFSSSCIKTHITCGMIVEKRYGGNRSFEKNNAGKRWSGAFLCQGTERAAFLSNFLPGYTPPYLLSLPAFPTCSLPFVTNIAFGREKAVLALAGFFLAKHFPIQKYHENHYW